MHGSCHFYDNNNNDDDGVSDDIDDGIYYDYL
jgi:hypothetical protein